MFFNPRLFSDMDRIIWNKQVKANLLRYFYASEALMKGDLQHVQTE